MQRYSNRYFIVKALHVSGGFSAHHQELRNCTHSIGYCQAFLPPSANVGEWVEEKLDNTRGGVYRF
jgi:hypothetical protein